MGHELRRSETLRITKSTDCRRCLTFPLGAYFYCADGEHVGQPEISSAPEVLDSCLQSVDVVVGRLGREISTGSTDQPPRPPTELTHGDPGKANTPPATSTLHVHVGGSLRHQPT